MSRALKMGDSPKEGFVERDFDGRAIFVLRHLAGEAGISLGKIAE